MTDGNGYAEKEQKKCESKENGQADNLFGWKIIFRMAEGDKINFSDHFGKMMRNIGMFGIAGSQQIECYHQNGDGYHLPILENNLQGQRQKEGKGKSMEYEYFGSFGGMLQTH